MSNVYTDGSGTYFAPGNMNVSDPTHQDVNVRKETVYQTISMLVTDVETSLVSGWTVAPNLTDIGGGVWLGGLLVDPSGE